MDKTKAVKKHTKKPDKANLSKKLKTAAVLFLAIIILIGAVYAFGGFNAIEHLIFYSQSTIDSSVISDGGFPVDFSGNDIISVDKISSKLFVLSKKMLTCISSEGRPLFTESVSFIEPQMYVGEKYGVIFDRSSSKYTIFNTHGVVFNGNTEDNRHIITAVVDSKGNCAISTKSDDSACRVYVVDKKGEIKYIWSCGDEYVVNIDISPDGDKIICGALGSYSNEVYTKIYYLDIYSDDDCKEYKIDSTACIDVVFTDNNKVAVSCLDRRVVLDTRTEDGSPVETYYSGDIVKFCRDFKGNMVVITDKISSLGFDEITMYDKNNTVVFRSDVEENAVDLEQYGKNAYCLVGEKIIHFKSDGSVSKTSSCDMLTDGIVNIKGNIFVYTSGSVKNDF